MLCFLDTPCWKPVSCISSMKPVISVVVLLKGRSANASINIALDSTFVFCFLRTCLLGRISKNQNYRQIHNRSRRSIIVSIEKRDILASRDTMSLLDPLSAINFLLWSYSSTILFAPRPILYRLALEYNTTIIESDEKCSHSKDPPQIHSAW